jgi:NitT/TauT family transport system substrate-binding protein
MSTIARRRTGARHLAPLLLAALALGACGDDGESSSTTPVTAGADATPDSSPDTTPSALEGSMRLGYFPNVTHAPALVGVAQGTFAEALGDGVDLETFTFNAGTEAVEALLRSRWTSRSSGRTRRSMPSPSRTATAIRIISGSTSGGAYLVVRPGITSVEQLADKTLATPSLGNTQDVALRAWLKENGFETTPEGGGDVTILPQSNSTTLESFVSGDDRRCLGPEPWATRLIEEGGGVVLVDERDLWPGDRRRVRHHARHRAHRVPR